MVERERLELQRQRKERARAQPAANGSYQRRASPEPTVGLPVTSGAYDPWAEDDHERTARLEREARHTT